MPEYKAPDWWSDSDPDQLAKRITMLFWPLIQDEAIAGHIVSAGRQAATLLRDDMAAHDAAVRADQAEKTLREAAAEIVHSPAGTYERTGEAWAKQWLLRRAVALTPTTKDWRDDLTPERVAQVEHVMRLHGTPPTTKETEQ